MAPSLLQIIVLGIVQGAAELLPVSSTAHVIAAEKLMGLDASSPQMTFVLVMLHTGTMGAVIAYFWKSWRLTFFSSPERFAAAAGTVAVATGISAVVYVPLQYLVKRTLLRDHPGADVEELFSHTRLIASALVAAGILILVAGYRVRRAGAQASDPAPRPISLGSAIWIGVAQGIALPFRGFSRSGATISVGMLAGVQRRVCEEFSFALAVVITPPVIAQELRRFAHARAAAHAAVHIVELTKPGLVGMVMSFIAGLVALRWLSGWLENGRWHYFGFYCLVAGAAFYALAAWGY